MYQMVSADTAANIAMALKAELGKAQNRIKRLEERNKKLRKESVRKDKRIRELEQGTDKRKAYWQELLGCGYTVCSACDFIPYSISDKYCPNCGAKMDGGDAQR